MRKSNPIRFHSPNVEYELPVHLRTSWTSLDNERFASLVGVLGTVFSSEKDEDEPRQYVIGTKSVLQYIERNGMNIFCVIACVDNGGDVGLTSRLARVCYLNGIPLVFGRGHRELATAFGGKKRVCCVALTKMAASNSDLYDFIINMSSLTSRVAIPLEEVEDIKEKFIESCQAGKLVDQKRKSPEPVPSISAPPPKKLNSPDTKKKKATSFFASFD
jgi:hypothetical protein